MNTTLYTKDGAQSGSITLPEAVFNVAWNADLVHDVVLAMQGNERAGTAHTKDRSEVRGGGKKPWKQKGTGRARHGSRRSPIWVGGGVAHGPRSDKDYSTKLNRKVKAKALATVLSKKFADGEVICLEALTMNEPKSAAVKLMIGALAKGVNKADLATKRKNAALLVLPKRDLNVEKSVRNFGQLTTVVAKDVNPVDLLTYKYVVMVDAVTNIAALEKRVAVITPTK